MSAEQIARAAYDAGFRGEGLTIAVAVALAESGGDPRAHNDTPPDDSYGLWQINMLGGLGPARRRELGLDSDSELFDPERNARAANRISGDGRNWQPWSTYTDGAYRKHLDDARRAARKVAQQGPRRGGDRNDARRDADRGDARRGGDRRPAPGGGSGSGGNGGNGGGGSFAVETGLLRGYARGTRDVADRLGGTVVDHVRRVRDIADDSFGRIGKESGFAAALNGYALALQRQSRGVGENADKLATSTSRAATEYDRRDAAMAQTFSGIG